jgi:hypothetical protein
MLAAAIETAAARRPEPAAVGRALEPFSPAASARLLAAAFGYQSGQPVVATPVRIPA